ncbi:acyl-CoA ligase (AMP-forming), exosortase A system-associated [Colwellia piezophila]|uniref:acyl-CoA ligase (AMP-forming), exosortase A system-associated n=1 Tax=Colwellia piezophila TaxID=211668 RepID=UPI00036CB6C3|nr:acyl-CoA ligase (AMP-forming), exosortase A system-associated [Colwellia piezophila]
MISFVHELISHSAQRSADKIALQIQSSQISYSQLNNLINVVAQGFLSQGITQGDRVGIYLAKNPENVQSLFACSIVGAVFVPINPVLKTRQVQYIANNCQIKLLITNHARFKALAPLIEQFTTLFTIIVIDANEHELAQSPSTPGVTILSWQAFISHSPHTLKYSQSSSNPSSLAGILYTSGSTGQPKGIMLSHQNIILGALSVSEYLQLTEHDNILALLPLSFDYGLNQLTSCFFVGATCVLLDYLLANDVVKAISKYQITGLAAVPTLWQQLTKATWPRNSACSVRYFTNSGGELPLATLAILRKTMPQAKPYLMYGLTEAFRSSFLSPDEIDNKPNSIGKAIPHAEILVLREDGSECDNDEVGELVHIGPLVTLGYWKNEPATAARFKETPAQAQNTQNIALAVFSGDYVKRDADGFLFFVSRKDAMIKTSGYRVSPTELESVLLQLPQIEEAAVIPYPSVKLGQSITAFIVRASDNHPLSTAEVFKHCQLNVPNYMVPKEIIFLTELPINANGKIDSTQLKRRYSENNRPQIINNN